MGCRLSKYIRLAALLDATDAFEWIEDIDCQKSCPLFKQFVEVTDLYCDWFGLIFLNLSLQ